MNYLIIWTLKPGQREKSIGQFAEHTIVEKARG
jgi:hypothetical protein